MRQDPRDRIEQIRSQRGRDMVQIGTSPVETVGVAGIPGVGAEPSILGIDFRSPWLRDRVTLSLEAQIAMMEQRANYRLTLADLGYTNRISILPIRPGIYIKIEPTGCYRMVYHNR